MDKFVMPIGDAARALKLSTSRVQDFDADLQPKRLENGHRRYDPDLVAAFAAKRATK